MLKSCLIRYSSRTLSSDDSSADEEEDEDDEYEDEVISVVEESSLFLQDSELVWAACNNSILRQFQWLSFYSNRLQKLDVV